MRITKFSELSDKEIVNCKDGKILGYADDLKLDTDSGHIVSLVIEGKKICFGPKTEAIEIMWDSIEKIGDDIILVNIDSFPLSCNKNKNDKKSCFMC